MSPWFWIIGGPNGAGKTTYSLRFLKELAGIENFVNADLIAAGISPLQPEAEPVKAGKLMLQLVSEYVNNEKSFAVETTLSGETFGRLARKLKGNRWKVGFVYLWLETPDIALKRVEERVRLGGHRIPPKTVVRRHARGLAKLQSYLDLADRWLIFDNSYEAPSLVATKDGPKPVILRPEIYKRILP